MAKISKEVSSGLEAAIAEAQAKISDGTSAEDLLNAGITAHKKRHRRTKAEIEAAKAAEVNQAEESNSLFEEIIPKEEEEDNRPEWEKRRANNHEEFCEWELEKAKLKGLKEPNFDFRSFYETGQVVYYILILRGGIQTKELKKLKIRTIYPRMMVCNEEKACCQCIGYEDKDLIFDTLQDAEVMFKTINLKDEKELEKAQKKKKSHKGTDESFDDEDNLNDDYTSLEEAMGTDDED